MQESPHDKYDGRISVGLQQVADVQDSLREDSR